MSTPTALPPPCFGPARAPSDAGCEAQIRTVLAAMREPAAAAVYTAIFDEEALAAARAVDAARAAGRDPGPLAGLPITVKDLYDIAGRTTMAGSVLRAGRAPAQADAPAVARLKAAGAIVTGLTNMTEFAFSGVGINPHHGTPRNPADAAVARIPGGSSSGAGVSVALGHAFAALGSDTGGSIRVPPALCGLVGFKNTQARVPTAGAFPLSQTLDTVCAMARSVADVLRVDAVLSGAPLAVPTRPVRGLRLALPLTLMLDGLDATVSTAFARALARLRAAGAEVVEVPLTELAEIAQINAPGGLSAIEAWATHAADLQAQPEAFDHRVAARIRPGRDATPEQYRTILSRRAEWIPRVNARLQGFDALIAPTCPMVAPPVADLLASDEAFFAANGRLLRNPFAINFLDGCAFSLPCHTANELPVGLMLAAPGGADAALAGVALAVEALLQRQD